MEKILITGTGRAGTTFLIKLFSFLDYNTGFNRNNYKNYIAGNCNAGMEKGWRDRHYIIKNPTFIQDIDKIINDKQNIKIKEIIIPIRDFKASAQSRASHKIGAGGLWNAKNEEDQIVFYHKIMANYLYYMTKYEIKTTFLDFDNMVNDKQYLFNKLKHILDEKEISFELFSNVYDEVTLISKPKTAIVPPKTVPLTPVPPTTVPST